MGGALGGSQTSTTSVPKWLEDAGREALARAGEVSRVGYTPYYGPDVAAMNSTQLDAMRNTNSAANAFGLASSDPTANLPQAQTFANGVQGYSSGGLYDQSLAALQAARPGQYDAIMSQFIDPMTGAAAASASPVVNANPTQGYKFGGDRGPGDAGSSRGSATGGSSMSQSTGASF